MRTSTLVLLLAGAVNVSSYEQRGATSDDKVKNFNGETVGSSREKTLDKLTKVLNKADILDIHKKIAGLKDKIKAKLAISAEEAKALPEGLKLLKTKKVDKVQPVGDSIEEINMNSQVGEYLFQGDIVLTRSQAEEIVEDVNDDGSGRQRRQAFRDRRYPRTIWPKVPYFFDESAKKCDPHSSAQCLMRGFPHPRDCQKCICPSGYGGALCNERPSGCGQMFQASATIQTFKDTVGNRSLGTVPRGDFDKCHYWLTAPEGKKIEVKLSHFSPKGIAVDGCTYAGVEIKTNRDQRLTGYKFCSVSDIGSILRSESNDVPIITYNRIYGSDVTIEFRYI